jgi:hypothetical protein
MLKPDTYISTSLLKSTTFWYKAIEKNRNSTDESDQNGWTTEELLLWGLIKMVEFAHIKI